MPDPPRPSATGAVGVFILVTSANTLPALVVVECATCTGGLFPSSTGAYTIVLRARLLCNHKRRNSLATRARLVDGTYKEEPNSII